MLSRRSSDMGCHIGSKVTSIPSLRASLAAGTKSLSPAIRTIWSTRAYVQTKEQ
jgi:hypothetical protein